MNFTKEIADNLWEEELDIFQKLEEEGNLELYISEHVKNIQNAFRGEIGRVCCMDDRTPDGQARIAGSGILLALNNSDENEKEIKGLPKITNSGLDFVINEFKKLGIEEITSHNDCGAAGIYRDLTNPEEKDSDSYGITFSKKIAEDMKIKYTHINIDTNHAARTAYIDFTGEFNPDGIEGLPEGYVITAKIIPVEHVIEQAETAYKIASGNHSFGNRIDKNNPFYIFIIGENDNSNEIINKLNKLASNSEGKIVIDSYSK